jgi:hypothetical protein
VEHELLNVMHVCHGEASNERPMNGSTSDTALLTRIDLGAAQSGASRERAE